MKTRIFIALFLTTLALNLNAQDKTSKKKAKEQKRIEQFKETKALVESYKFMFEAENTTSSELGMVDLTTNYSYLKIINDSTFMRLPFFGRAYNSTIGEEGGIRCENLYSDVNLEVNEEKYTISFSFDVKGENDIYKVKMDIYRNGSASLSIISNNRAMVTYSGNISAIKEEKPKY